MHRVQSRTYVGQPRETVSVNAAVSGGGQVSVTVGGQPLASGQFQLPGTPGASVRLQIALAGPQGASCVVTVSVVDGGSDADFLLCSVFNPAPVNFYDFSVAAAAAVTSLAAAKGVPVAAVNRRPAAKPKPKPRTAPSSRRRK
jgi:hypothetical protein